jgi:cytochrome c biogenesis protein CcmG/thiol:disulfide interchange protein DsbE
MTETTTDKPTPRKTNWAVYLPVAAFLALAGLFAVMLLQPGRDASVLPSALIGKKAPQTVLPPVPGLLGPDGAPLPGFDPATFGEGPVLVNIWASWCGPCREEHPLLMALAAAPGVKIAGINQKDKPENAAGFLAELGNPYTMAGADTKGRASIEWGVYGIPETFVVGADGTILYKHVGPLTPQVTAEKILPLLQPAQSGD